MKPVQDRQRIAKCGCHYDVVSGLITQYCQNLEGCDFKTERLTVIRATKAAPGMGHLMRTQIQ